MMYHDQDSYNLLSFRPQFFVVRRVHDMHAQHQVIDRLMLAE